VSCSVEDDAGASDSDSFTVTVVDTTAPALSGVPADRSVPADGPSGAAVTFSSPSATDVVDSSPAVACAPASGSTFAVGTTAVTCTATDDSGNTSTAGFDVTVAPFEPEVPPTEEPPGEEPPTPTASATWLEPVAASGGTFAANRGRTIPVKVRLFVDRRERRQGDAGLALAPCGGGSSSYVDLWWGGGRWNHALDTSRLAGSCYVVKATINDLVAGKFTLDLRGGEAAKARRTPPAPKHVAPRHEKVKHHPWHRPRAAARHGCR
jgi:hypothetical protein